MESANPPDPLDLLKRPPKPEPRRINWLFWIVVMNIGIWGLFAIITLAKPGGMMGIPANPLDPGADPGADFSQGCGENSSRAGNVCIDRYEFPNQPGELPKILATAGDAKAACESAGKRLCSMEEHRLGCSAPRAGGDFSPRAMELACNIISRYSEHGVTLTRSGEMRGCMTRKGLYDVIGNLAEWVETERGPELTGGNYLQRVSSMSNCRTSRPAGPGYHPSARGTRCCKDAPPLSPEKK